MKKIVNIPNGTFATNLVAVYYDDGKDGKDGKHS